MDSYVSIDNHGNFTLEGKPWFLHAAVYFGRRPGTCGADWMGENFEHNMSFLDRDIDTMQDLGINTLGLFVPSNLFFEGLEPVMERFDQLDRFLERIRQGGIRTIIFDLRTIGKDAWCSARKIEPPEGLWNPALEPEAEAAFIETKRRLHTPFSDRPEIVGWAIQISRFFRYGFSVPPVGEAWSKWLKQRFDGDFERARLLLDLTPDESDWKQIRMPTEMEPYFNQLNPRSFEFAVMQQELVTQATNRAIEAVRPFTPNHLMVTSMEGCCFSSGHLTSLVPEKLQADALWIEYYHWEGLRSYHLVSEEDRLWMPEPVADKPSVEILNAAGYVQMVTQWMKRSGKPLIMCHGVDIGDVRRGVRTEEDQYKLLDRYNTFYHEAGGQGIAYWCWNDDELSKTYTRQFGYEFGSDTDESEKAYQQAGETMGIVRYDGTPRPVADRIRARSEKMAGRAAKPSPGNVLVLLPSPVFQGLYRYRANLTAFGIFTSLARQGVIAEVEMTSAGTTLLSLDDLLSYRWIILGAADYRRDHLEVPELLLQYVRQGGALFLPLATCDSLVDPYLKVHASDALRTLAGAEVCEIEERTQLTEIRGEHPAFAEGLPDRWDLTMDEPARFARVILPASAEVLATATGEPLLYRHSVGEGTVYVYTWNMDVFIYDEATLDYYKVTWDWMWQGITQEEGIERRLDNPMRKVIHEIMAEGSAAGAETSENESTGG